jgi:septum formation inhibitor MinC
VKKIKLNISGNVVSIIIPTTQTFLNLKEHLKEILLKNYKLLRTLKFYKIESYDLDEKEFLELGKEVESITQLKNLEKIEKNKEKDKKKNKFQVHYGNLRSGEKMTSDTNLIILGNLNPGSYVKSKKNVFIYGKARGTIQAGSEIDKYQSSFIYIEEADKPKVRIGNKQILYDENKNTANLVFEKKSSKINVKKIERTEIQKLLQKIGFNLI